MFKALFLAGALSLAAGQALAHDDYYGPRGRVVTVEPSISFSFGSRHDGVGVQYHSGGRYYYDAPRYPVRLIGAPSYHYYYDAPRGHGYKHRHGHRHDDDRSHRRYRYRDD